MIFRCVSAPSGSRFPSRHGSEENARTHFAPDRPAWRGCAENSISTDSEAPDDKPLTFLVDEMAERRWFQTRPLIFLTHVASLRRASLARVRRQPVPDREPPMR